MFSKAKRFNYPKPQECRDNCRHCENKQMSAKKRLDNLEKNGKQMIKWRYTDIGSGLYRTWNTLALENEFPLQSPREAKRSPPKSLTSGINRIAPRSLSFSASKVVKPLKAKKIVTRHSDVGTKRYQFWSLDCESPPPEMFSSTPVTSPVKSSLKKITESLNNIQRLEKYKANIRMKKLAQEIRSFNLERTESLSSSDDGICTRSPTLSKSSDEQDLRERNLLETVFWCQEMYKKGTEEMDSLLEELTNLNI